MDAVYSLKSYFQMPSLGLWALEMSLTHIYECVYVDSSEWLKIFLLRDGFYKISCDYFLVVCLYGWS